MEVSKQNIGNSGEFYLASFLSARDFVVTVTLGRNEGYDLIVVNKNGKPIKMSVKTRLLKERQRFPLSPKDERPRGKDFFYAFVRLNEFKEEPDFWIVPANIVSELIRKSHQDWLNGTSPRGKERKENNMRNFWIIESKYFPNGWGEEIKKYYKNVKQLEDLR